MRAYSSQSSQDGLSLRSNYQHQHQHPKPTTSQPSEQRRKTPNLSTNTYIRKDQYIRSKRRGIAVLLLGSLFVSILVASSPPVTVDYSSVIPVGIANQNVEKEKSKQSTNNKLLLCVPFYVYDEMDWMNATWDGQPIAEQKRDQKHSDDYWFVYHALRHPMRTWKASDAKLFVIPTLNNIYDTRSYYKHKDLCIQEKCNADLMKSAAAQIQALPYFQQHPEAHLAVVSHYVHSKSFWKTKMPRPYREILEQVANIHFEDKPTNRPPLWAAPKTYVSNPCPLSKKNNNNNTKTHDIALIASIKPKDPRFQDRSILCSWLQNTTTSFRMEFCASGGPMCPTLANAKLGFHVRGDSYGSARLVDTMLSGTLPIFTLRKQYLILPQWFAWKRISYFTDIKRLKQEAEESSPPSTFVKALKKILANEGEYQEKRNLMMAHLPYFDWKTTYPFDTYMYMLQAHLYPETRHPSNFLGPNSLLLLPPQVAP